MIATEHNAATTASVIDETRLRTRTRYRRREPKDDGR
jgi:hypothetical protein